MRKLGYNEQIKLVCDFFQAEIDKLKSLPEEEARIMAHENLVRIGLINEDGSLSEPYVRMNERYKQGLGFAQTIEERERCKCIYNIHEPEKT